MIEIIKELAWEYRYILILIVAVAIYAIFEWSSLKVKIYSLMLQAKRLAQDVVLTSGKEQENWVVEKAYIILPSFTRLFISKELLQKIIKYLYDKAKDYMDDGHINNSI